MADSRLRIDVLSLFPEFFRSPLEISILRRAQEKGLLEVNAVSIREFGEGRHRTTDEPPFGGGAGMVMKPEPIFRAVEAVLGLPEGRIARGRISEGFEGRAARRRELGARVILLTPQGEVFTQSKAAELAEESRLVMICGRYEGFDERVREHLATDEISIGDYVLTGGEPAALVVMDAVVRLLPGALGAEESPAEESFATGLLEYPHYTRPAIFRGWGVPETLLSGDHEEIRRWRRLQALKRTLERRPELLESAPLTREDRELLRELLMRVFGLD